MNPRPDPSPAERDPLPLPAGFRLLDDKDAGIELRVPVVVFPFGDGRQGPVRRLIWGGIVVPLIVGGLYGEYFGFVVALAVALLWLALCVLAISMTRRVVAIRPEGVEVAWWPVPFLSRRLVSRELKQAFVRKRGAPLDILPGDRDDRAATMYELWVVRPDGRKELLVGSLKSAEHAEWLRGWLERRLEMAGGAAAAGASGGAEGS